MAEYVAERQKRNLAFWERTPQERPLIGVAVNITFPGLSFTHQIEDEVVSPDMIRPEVYFEDWDRTYAACEARGEELFMAASPLASVPWMEAIAGCTVRMVPESGSMWAEYPDSLPLNWRQVKFDASNAWFRKLIEFSEALAAHASGRYPVGNPILRGVSDMVAAIMGPTRMVYELLDRPERVSELAERCAEIWQCVAPALTIAKGSYLDGSCADRRRVWAPGYCLLYQEDAAALMSPNMFEQFILPHTAAVLRPYDYTVIHTHSDTLRIVGEVLSDLCELSAIEVLLDPSGPQGQALIPVFKRILAKKSMIICGEMPLDLIELFWRELPDAGLCLQPKVDNEKEGDLLFQQMLALENNKNRMDTSGRLYAD